MNTFPVVVVPTIEPATKLRRGGGPPVELTEFTCLECDGDLIWHQPDVERPGRLLGTCPDCGEWHVFDDSTGDGGLFVVIPRPVV